MRIPKLSFVFALTAAVALGACVEFDRSNSSSSTAPSAPGVSGLMGVWTSANIIPSPSTCTDFKWNVTEKTSTSAKGSFSATCANNLKVSGTAQGTLSGSTITWSATGNASAPDLPACAIKLTGTAELGVDSIRIPYSGDTCVGKVSGVEILKKH
jgi:hypothetical protein